MAGTAVAVAEAVAENVTDAELAERGHGQLAVLCSYCGVGGNNYAYLTKYQAFKSCSMQQT